ncbi:MAG: lysylphosphatidylglycerol synthase domain-containing protein [Candidatus Helarchaeota archaeon]|nr:lysylphosphatidylglycerol synthase domain-containing protein [Candidatus Helarchaeota archaeon]
MNHFFRKTSKWLPYLVFGIVLAILAFVIYKQRQEILDFPWKINLLYLLTASIFHSLALFVTFIVWSMMVYRLSGFKDYWLNFKNYYLSSMAKRVPTSLPYIGSRISFYAESKVSVPVILNCIFLENILITISGVIFFLSFIPFYSNIDKNIVVPISIVGIVLIAISLIKPQILIEITNWVLRKFKRDEIKITLNRNDLIAWVGIYLFSWLFAGLSFNFLIRSVGVFNYPPLGDVFGISSALTLVGLISMVFPGGFGMKEITAGLMLIPWIPFSTGLIITIANRVMQTIDDVIWSVLALVSTQLVKQRNPRPGSDNNTNGLL